jgi:hypothetical protein
MGRFLPLIVCGVCGAIMFLQYFSPHPLARAVNRGMLDYWQILSAIALVVGVVGVARTNLMGFFAGRDRFNRATVISGIFAMPSLAWLWGTTAGSPFVWMFEYVQMPMQATVFALLAFFVASASFRGFRARNAQATVLLISAILILVSRLSFGEGFLAEVQWFGDWMRDNPSMAARRAILIGIGLGSLTTSLRVILGVERTWLGGSK